MRVCMCLKPPLLVVGLSTITIALAETRSETCELEGSCVSSERGPALLQISRTAPTEPVAKYPIETITACNDKLNGSSCVSGSKASLDEVGYQQIAKKCCHHEMSQFVRREIARQEFKICDLSGLHGFVHWYDCKDDGRTFAIMREEISKAHAIECAWLGKVGSDCPIKGSNCANDFPACPAKFPELSLRGSVAPLSQNGYAAVRLRCCHVDMEQFVLREIDRQKLFVCVEGMLKGFLHWYDCVDDGPGQTYAKMVEEIAFARSGANCPWLGSIGKECPAQGKNCGQNEAQDATAHRRRTHCSKNGSCNLPKTPEEKEKRV